MGNEISLAGAFLAGIISFLSPCVLPLVPAYLSFLAGVTWEEMQSGEKGKTRKRVILAAVVFVLGFSLVFTLLGASATVLGKWLAAQAFWLGRVAGALLIVLGLHLTGIWQIPFLLFEKRFHVQKRRINLFGVFIVGMAFAFGWSPCVGPLLAGILALAGTKETVSQGILLLGVYSLGLGLPFIAAAAAVERFVYWSSRFRRYLRIVEIAAGILLILIGGVMLFGGMMRLAGFFSIFGRFGL
ncbi:cytochrome c biogenesis protein CcdA [candidate division FCPU426 bacterium]|nr:cytochrome c biogenesis protein CcdA [candidate division FCPU426 bacterium]